MDVKKKLYVVWNCSRRMSKYCLAATLEDLRMTGSEALAVDQPVNKIRVVINKCGADVEDERLFQALPILCELMLLTEEQIWPGTSPINDGMTRKQNESTIKPEEYTANNILRQLFEEKAYELMLVDDEHPEDIPDFLENFKEIQPIASMMSENHDKRCMALLMEKKGLEAASLSG